MPSMHRSASGSLRETCTAATLTCTSSMNEDRWVLFLFLFSNDDNEIWFPQMTATKRYCVPDQEKKKEKRKKKKKKKKNRCEKKRKKNQL